MNSRTLYPSKKHGLMMLAGSLLFVVVGIWALRDSGFMWFPNIFFGACGIVFAINLIPRASFLRIEEEGITFVSLFRSRTLRWSEVVAFYPGKVGRTAMVLYDFTSPSAACAKMRHANIALCGHEAALPDTYGFSAEGLAHLLNECKEKSQK